MGKIITFYSYKGGVGRSMALADIGVILSKWGKRTLLIDWDLEAPGLENYFKPYFTNYNMVIQKEGLIDILTNKIKISSYNNKVIAWEEYYTHIPFDENSNLYLLTSGKKGDDYINKVRQFDFSAFYEEHEGGDFLEDLREYWKKSFDYVLIDSRTGLTDSSGICSIQMPDILVLLFTATEQGFKGTLNVANKSKISQQQLIYDRLKLKVFPIPTRFDNAELKLTEEWLGKFAAELTEVYNDFIPCDKEGSSLIHPLDILVRTKIPQISFYSYGEKLPVIEQGSDDPNSIGYVHETIAAVLVNDFKEINRLKDERDLYIRMAKGEDIISYVYFQKKISEEQEEKQKLREELRKREEELDKLKMQKDVLEENTDYKLFRNEWGSIKDEKEKIRKQRLYINVLLIVIFLIGAILFVVYILNRQSGMQNANNSNVDSTASPLNGNTNIMADPDYQKGLALVTGSDCFTCHGIAVKKIGPSFEDIANKYANHISSISYLTYKIIKGGSGVWGTVSMTGHPGLLSNSAEQMAKYILLLKTK